MRRWHYVKAELSLVSGSDTVALTPKAAAVLDCLLAHKGQVVGREELLKTVWAGLHVTQDLVREYVFDLRRALGDDARRPAYIETIRGRGFRLIGDVVPAGREVMPPLASERPTREIRAPVAVLRPETIGGTAGLATLADAMALGFERSGTGEELAILHTGGTWGSTAILWAHPEAGKGAVMIMGRSI